MKIRTSLKSSRRVALILLLAASVGVAPRAYAQAVTNPISLSATHAVPGTPLTISAQVTGQGREYRFDFGDRTPDSGWLTTPSVTHTYAQRGHYNVMLQVRDSQGGLEIFRRVVTVMTAPTPAKSSSSSPLALNEATGELWVVNPDNDSVSKIVSDALVGEYPLGEGCHPRSVALDSQQQAWVTCHERDTLKVVNNAGQVVRTVNLDYGSAPFGVVMSPDGTTAYVSLYGKGGVASFNTRTFAQAGSLALGPTPRALALSADGRRLMVTRFISPESRGEVWDVGIQGQTLTLSRTIPLIEDTISAETTQSGRGVPNYLASVSFDREMKRAWVVYKKDNVHRGLVLNGVDLNQENSVRTSISEIDLATNAEVFSQRRDIDNTDSPTGVAFSELGDYAFVTLQGNNIVAIYDALLPVQQGQFAPLLLRVKVGSAPQGIIFDTRRKVLYVHDFLTRTVSVLDAKEFVEGTSSNLTVKSVATIRTDKLSAQVLKGKQIFYNASDGAGPNGRNKMSGEGYISCATCHVDGGSDHRVWDFTGRGEGLRNTTDLRGRAGMGHGRVHWSGNFDEIQDFENDIRNAFGGAGFMSDADFVATSDTLGAKKAGKSPDLDALAAYVVSLGRERLPRSPFRNSDGTMTDAAKRGQAVFRAQGCDSCHNGNQFTDSVLDRVLLHDVGTITEKSGSRLGGKLEGIDTPTLLGVFDGAPYLHDGSATTIADVFTKGSVHSRVGSLAASSRDDLIQFLLQLDSSPVETVVPTPTPVATPTVRPTTAPIVTPQPTVTPLPATPSPGDNRYVEVGRKLDELAASINAEITKPGLIGRQEVRQLQSLFNSVSTLARRVQPGAGKKNAHLRILITIERYKVTLLRATRAKTESSQNERLQGVIAGIGRIKAMLP